MSGEVVAIGEEGVKKVSYGGCHGVLEGWLRLCSTRWVECEEDAVHSYHVLKAVMVFVNGVTFGLKQAI